MPIDAPLRKQLAKVVLYPVLSLFLLPLLAFLFVQHAVPRIDETYLASIARNIDKDNTLGAAEKLREKQFFQAYPPSSMCENTDPRLARYREGVCAEYSELWQFVHVERLSLWTLACGAAALLLVLLLGLLAFYNRRTRYLSFLLGWRLLTLVSAAEVVVQGVLLVWLSYWVTAFFFHSYFPKLIILAGIFVGLAVFATVVHIFRRPPTDTALDGELLSAQDAPLLWAHVRELASKLKTRAPDQIVVGIDSNFFVTEAPVTVAGRELRGRTLYLSLPLLGILERKEADAVLAHELAHLGGGDTASSAALGPKLAQYDYYSAMMSQGGLTILVFYLLQLYRVIFEFALKKESRLREFLADRTAAALVSARDIVVSLIKLAAYSNYRGKIENSLFEQNRQHEGALGIAGNIAAGLAPYASSAEFLTAMKSANVPHPFDTHPPLSERIANVGCRINAKDLGSIAGGAPAQSWLADIPVAPAIEQRLWADYEKQFASEHEKHLAYRYEPANEAERAVVLRYFPPVAFALRGGKRIEVSYAGLTLPARAELLSWDQVSALNYENGLGGDVLQVTHPEKGWMGPKRTKVKLPGIKKERERFKQLMGQYWQRHQYMRQQMAARG